jgi:hypothetical protein
MSPVAAPGIYARTAERFPYLSHRTVDETGYSSGDLFCTPDHVSTVPILIGFGAPDCWEFRFIIPGDGR